MTGSRHVERVAMRCDEYISADLRLFPMDDEYLILSVDGPDGKGAHIAINPTDGGLRSLTLTAPLPTIAIPPESADVEHGPSGELPCFDVTELLAESGPSGFNRWIKVSAPLAEGSRGDDRVIRLGEGVVAAVYEAHGLACGVADDGTLLEITIRRSLINAATGW